VGGGVAGGVARRSSCRPPLARSRFTRALASHCLTASHRPSLPLAASLPHSASASQPLSGPSLPHQYHSRHTHKDSLPLTAPHCLTSTKVGTPTTTHTHCRSVGPHCPSQPLSGPSLPHQYEYPLPLALRRSLPLSLCLTSRLCVPSASYTLISM